MSKVVRDVIDRMSRRRRATIASLALLAAIAVALASYSLATGEGPLGGGNIHGPGPEDAANIANPPEQFPEVVATVNGAPITGRQLAYQVETLKSGYLQTGSPAPGADKLADVALNQLIDMEVWVQAGIEAGLTPSQEDVSVYLRERQAEIDSLPKGSPEYSALEVLALGFGYNLGDLESSALLRDYSQRTMVATRMENKVVEALPPGEQSDSRAVVTATQAFLASRRAKAQIQIVTPLAQ